MSVPFSLRMDDDIREQLIIHAERADVSPSRWVNRYVKEGLQRAIRCDGDVERPVVPMARALGGRR